uniref:Protein kinase domain-containing protein n=1 Tax=Parastrongyloides trichosuri TaxID=131310 RepID=A0A0N4ZMF7_PARTI
MDMKNAAYKGESLPKLSNDIPKEIYGEVTKNSYRLFPESIISGTFGDYIYGKNQTSQRKVCLRFISEYGVKVFTDIYEYFSAIQKNLEYILPFIGADVAKGYDTFFCIWEKEFINLKLYKAKFSVAPSCTRQYLVFEQMLSSLQYFHNNGFVHGNLTLESFWAHSIDPVTKVFTSVVLGDIDLLTRPNYWNSNNKLKKSFLMKDIYEKRMDAKLKNFAFCALKQHTGERISAKNDIESWFYICVHLLENSFDLVTLSKNEDAVLHEKQKMRQPTYTNFENTSIRFAEILILLDKMKGNIPDYEIVYRRIQSAARHATVKDKIDANFTEPSDYLEMAYEHRIRVKYLEKMIKKREDEINKMISEERKKLAKYDGLKTCEKDTIYDKKKDLKTALKSSVDIECKNFASTEAGKAVVTCPYYNWIDNLNYTYFKPHYFNKNNGPKQNHNKLTKHILVPAFPTSVDKRNIFICGYIYQKFLPIVKVGYKLYNSKPYNLSEVKISDKYIECNGVNVTNEYIYVYDQENIFFNSVIFIEKLKLLYSRDYIIVYNKEQIYEAYYEYLKFIKDLPNDQIQNFLEIGKTYFSPSCVGQVNNIPATLKLKFDSDSFVKEIKDITSSNISKTYIIIVDNLKLNKSKVNVGCIAVPDYLNDSKFDSFYNNRFQINLYKGRLNRYYRESLITSIDFSSLPENIYGIYSCSFKYMIYFRPVNFTEYIILPVNQIHLQKFIETITDNEVDIFCNKTFNEIGDLVEMILTTNFGLIYSNFYNKSKFENSNDGLFFLTDNINEVNGANVKCIYKFQGMNYLTLEKEISVIVSPKLSIRWLSWLNSPYTKIGTSFFGVIFGILMLIAFLKWSINRKLIKNEKSFDEEEMTSEESSKINTHS